MIATVVDIGIVIALAEEFREFFPFIRDRHTPVEDPTHGQTYYLFDHPASQPYRCVASFVGSQGEQSCGLLTERMLTRWRPQAVVMLGIAGGLHRDVAVGDVVCAKQIDSYLESAKALHESGATFTFERSGEVFRAPEPLLNRLRHLEFRPEQPFDSWQRECAADLAQLLPAERRQELLRAGLVGEAPRWLDGHLATGPVVGAAVAFTRWLHGRDRAYRALDMESGGLMRAAQGSPAQTLVLRGISDLADERKGAMERIGEGALRRYAMRNAIRFLWTVLSAQVLPRAQVGARPQQAIAVPGPSVPALRARLGQVLISDSDLDAFCLDYFPDVKRRFTNGMDRVQKINLLLEHADAGTISQRLDEAAPPGSAAPGSQVAAGPRSVIVMGSVQGSTIITGDRNKVE